MELTAAECEAVEKGSIVKYVIPDSRVECVVVREDLLDLLRVRSDYSLCDPDELGKLTSEVLDDEDWTMPEGSATQQLS